MTIGDDGIASICMGKEHVGNPCERCGHTQEVTCPDCKGKGDSMAFVCGSRCDFRAVQCSTCKGSGSVTPERVVFMKEAEVIRKDRMGRDLSIREEAKRLHVDFAEWSRIEGGRFPETEAGKRALEIRRGELTPNA